MASYVYIIECSDGSYYTGLTQNLKKRFGEHVTGMSTYTKNRRPVKLGFYCCFTNKLTAAKFEQYLKSHSGIAFRNKHLVGVAKPSKAVPP